MPRSNPVGENKEVLGYAVSIAGKDLERSALLGKHARFRHR
jgi:hypothetical protein